MGLREKVAEALYEAPTGTRGMSKLLAKDANERRVNAVMEVVEGHWTPDAAKVLDLTEQADELKEDVRHWRAEATDAKRIMDRRGEYVKELKSRVRELEEENTRLRALVGDLAEDGACWYDHHGYCQEHGWFATDPRCPHARARDIAKEDK